MLTVRRFEVTGFWGTHTASIEFDKGVNFLIGRNGSGKTTFLNLLAALLKGDFGTLERADFTKIALELRDDSSQSIPEIEIHKKYVNGIRTPNSIRYRPQKKSKWLECSAPAVLDARRRLRSTITQSESLFSQFNIENFLSESLKLTWLSIHRATLGRRYDDGTTAESTVDAKVKEISQNLGSYFSLLDAKVSKETLTFQEHIFLSLLFDPKFNYDPFAQKFKVDTQKERDNLRNIFSKFKVPAEKYMPRLQAHFDAVDGALDRQKTKAGLMIADFTALLDTQRIRMLSEEWDKVQEKTRTIYYAKDNFLNIFNSQLINKRLLIDPRNRPIIETSEGKFFDPSVLSSGEKQLYILLGEALLHEGQPFVFIADEPELSLHVDWQSNLVENLRSLNENMQIIFATHSPDIVSVYQDHVIRMEEHVL